ncbi:MAG: carboxypeptidase-like regulatory domain-containing protein, partial [Opitutales bacterium]
GAVAQGVAIIATQAPGDAVVRGITDATGRYAMTVGAGKWELIAEPPSASADLSYRGNPKRLSFRDDDSTESKEVSFTLTRITGGLLTGRFLKPGGNADWSSETVDRPIEITAFDEEGFGMETTLGADGTFSIQLPKGVYELVAKLPHDLGYEPFRQIVTVVSDLDLGDLSLAARSSTIFGVVTAAFDGRPLPNVQVHLWNEEGDFQVEATDADGRYSVPVKPGTWWAKAMPPPSELGKSAYSSTGPAFANLSGSTDFALPSLNYEISGFVLNQSGLPIRDFSHPVMAWQIMRGQRIIIASSEVDASGRYELRLPMVEVTVGLHPLAASDYQLIPEAVQGDSLAWQTSATQGLYSASANLTVANFQSTLSGRFTIDDQAVSGLNGTVYATGAGGNWQATSIDDDGSYSLTLTEGSWQIEYYLTNLNELGLDAAPSPNPIPSKTLAKGEAATLDFELAIMKTTTLTVRILDEQGVALSYPSYVWVEKANGARVDADWFREEIDTVTGTAALEVPAGMKVVVGAYLSPLARELGYRAPNTVIVDVPGASSLIVDLTATKQVAGDSISGVVTMSDGSPLPEAFVYGWSAKGQSSHTVADANGKFTLPVTGGATWRIGADGVIFENNAKKHFVTKRHLFVDLREKPSRENISLVVEAPDFSPPETITELFDPRTDHLVEMGDGMTVHLAANSLPVDQGVTQVYLVIDPVVSGLSRNAEEAPINYGYS